MATTPLTAPSAPGPTSVHARRVIFIDLGRALAVVFMLYGHTVSALLAPEYQQGRIFEAWQFQRGLTSTLFLILGGFAFSIATVRHWASHTRWSAALPRRLRRFGLFIVLGYALHFPVGRIVDLATVSDERWRLFLSVDVLQLIGTTLVALQLLVLVARSRRVFALVAFAAAIALTLGTPAAWSTDWQATLPLGVAAYLSPATGSLFPVFPWMALVLVGAGLGQVYARWGAAHLPAFAARALVVPGVAMLVSGIVLRVWPPVLFGTGTGAMVPAQVLTRVGTSLLILAAIAHLSRRMTGLPHVFGAVAQESLLIYFVHLCIVYGSVWNRGLVGFIGPTLSPVQTLGFVVLVVTSMVALAWYWNRWKHVQPRSARWAALATGVVLGVMIVL